MREEREGVDGDDEMKYRGKSRCACMDGQEGRARLCFCHGAGVGQL
jgi:hypothetical protein